MSAEQLVVLALLVAAFAAGWFARGSDAAQAQDDPPTAEVPPPTEPLPATPLPAPRPALPTDRVPRPLDVALRALDLANAAYETAVDRWLDEGAEITPAGRAARGELDRAIQRADVAAVRIEEGTEPRFSALDALEALREASRLLQAYREGRAIDAGTSRELDRLEDEIGRARAVLAP